MTKLLGSLPLAIVATKHVPHMVLVSNVVATATATRSSIKSVCLEQMEAEAEFVFFGDIGRCLIGNEIRTLMRSCPKAGDIPNQISSLVAQKFQLTINVTNRAFERKNCSYQVKSIDCAYGRQSVIPQVTDDESTTHYSHPTLTAPPVDKGKNIFGETSTSATSSSPKDYTDPDAAMLGATTTDKTLAQASDGTPATQETPYETSMLTTKITKDDKEIGTSDKRVCRHLCKDDSIVDDMDRNETISDVDKINTSDTTPDLRATYFPSNQKSRQLKEVKEVLNEQLIFK